MSEQLTDPALTALEETPPVGSGAPSASGSEVDAGSGSWDPEAWVEKDRFNGLMASLSRKDNEVKALQAQMAEMESRLNSKPPQQESQPLTDTSALEQQVAQLTQMLTTERLDGARKAALEAHPEAVPFADLIQASTAEDYMEMAAAIAERVKSVSGTAEPATEPAEPVVEQPPAAEATPPAPVAPVVGGGAAFSASAATQDRVAEAIKGGNWSEYLAAKHQAAVEADPDLQLETD